MCVLIKINFLKQNVETSRGTTRVSKELKQRLNTSHGMTKKNKIMVVVGECAASCVEDASTTCFSPTTSNFLYETIENTNANDENDDLVIMRQRKQSSNTLGIYCLVGDLSEGTFGAAAVMCMSGQKCKVNCAKCCVKVCFIHRDKINF